MADRLAIGGLLAEIGARIGIGLALDDDGQCGLLYGDDRELTVEVPLNGEGIILHSPLITAPANDRAAFFERVLTLNLYGLETGGCLLGFDPEHSQIVLALNHPANGVDLLGLENLIGTFIETAERLRRNLEIAEGDEPVGRAAPEEMLANLQMRV